MKMMMNVRAPLISLRKWQALVGHDAYTELKQNTLHTSISTLISNSILIERNC